jgi:transposase-like protein
MRYLAAEKLEIIRLLEPSHLPVRRPLRPLGIPPATFYRWYERYQDGGPAALADRRSRPDRVWNRRPEAPRGRILDLALAEPELSPRELAVRFTEQARSFVSEASVYRLRQAPDLIPSPAFIVVKAADEFHTKTTAPVHGTAVNALADRLHLPQGHRLGRVPSLHRAGRLLPRSAWPLNQWRAQASPSPGSSAPPWRRATSPKPLRSPWRPPAAARRGSGTDPGYSPTTGQATSQASWPSGSMPTAWRLFAVPPAPRKPRVRSSAGSRR